MFGKRSISRMNSVGEDEDVYCDSGHVTEYEIDGYTSIGQRHKPNLNVSERELYPRQTPELISFIDIDSVEEPPPLCDSLTVQRGYSSFRSSDSIREYSGEHKRKLQRQTSTELTGLSKDLNTLGIDACYVEEIFKQDENGDNVINLAIILFPKIQPVLAKMLISIVPCHSLLNSFNNLFQTSIHLAALTDNDTIVRRLMVAGANVALRDRFGNTALHTACRKGFLKVAKAILEPVRYPETKENSYPIPYQKIPQNLELRNSDGLTCFLISAYNYDIDMMELLLSKYANINAHDMKNGKTALHIFAETGNLVMVEFLVSKRGINLNQRTYASFTALELASYRGHTDVVSYLLRHGCNSVIRCISSNEFDAESSESDMSDVE